jgi:hypothetical protein
VKEGTQVTASLSEMRWKKEKASCGNDSKISISILCVSLSTRCRHLSPTVNLAVNHKLDKWMLDCVFDASTLSQALTATGSEERKLTLPVGYERSKKRMDFDP